MALLMIQLLRRMEVGEVAMIGVYKHWKRVSQEIMPPCFKGVDDCKEFSIIDLIVPFSRGE